MLHKMLVTCVAQRAFLDLTVNPAQVGNIDRPFVVTATSMVTRQITFGQLKTVRDLPDTATDETWEEFYKDHDGNVSEAVENYYLFLTQGIEGEGLNTEESDPEKVTSEDKAPGKKAKRKADKDAEAKASEEPIVAPTEE